MYKSRIQDVITKKLLVRGFLQKCVVLYTEDIDLFEVCASNFNIVEELPDLWNFRGIKNVDVAAVEDVLHDIKNTNMKIF